MRLLGGGGGGGGGRFAAYFDFERCAHEQAWTLEF